MEDVLVKATAGDARIYAVTTTHLTQYMNEIHHCSPLAAAALGRTAAGALLLAATMKSGEAVTVRFKGDGPLGQVMADARDYTVRGFVMHPEVMLPLKNGKLDVGGVGHYGTVTVTRCPLIGKPFTGVSTIKSGEIAADLTRYLAVSEQTPSSVALGVLIEKDGSVKVAGGFFVQLLPDAAETTIKTLEDNILTLPYVTELLQSGLDAEGMIRKVAKGLDVEILESHPVSFHCSCSREKVAGMLAGLPEKDFDELLQDPKTEVHCQYCNKSYEFTQQELKELKQKA
ncbi:Hsp33 family molecular chaperone HslO [Acidaminococcus timonensis]|uniref:Hsp33 family molecular chaperone HslO n=1 Tax=Acidaminococcus timonensis TaxID=1871002 RepID=UPI0026EC770D|nr:Hsp33 family molecular chaperone HslO [Acidaminococcus timonensis]